MKIAKPDTEIIKQFLQDRDNAINPRDKAVIALNMTNFFHNYYMEKVEIILGIAGEMQKHFKENQ